MFIFLASISAFAATLIPIASFDSHFQVDHPELQHRMWTNPEEVIDGKDNDGNDLVDDIHGWNFGDNNNVMWEEESAIYPEEMGLYAEIRMRNRANVISPEEKVWLDTNAPKYESLWRNYISFIHGTSSATVILKDTMHVRIIGLREATKESLIPSSQSPINPTPQGDASEEEIEDFKNQYLKEVVSFYLKTIQYAEAKKARALQFGVLWQLTKDTGKSIKKRFEARRGLTISDERAQKLAHDFYVSLLKESKNFFTDRPHMLFFMASGNGSNDNDLTISFPQDIPGENAIVVGASDFYMNLAAFSSYGKENVDILIPTINIVESVPNNLTLVSSATSVSVALITNVAARVMELNPNLNALDVKRVLYQTADIRTHLADFVKTSSIVNKERAVEAARLSRFMSLDLAIERSYQVVPK